MLAGSRGRVAFSRHHLCAQRSGAAIACRMRLFEPCHSLAGDSGGRTNEEFPNEFLRRLRTCFRFVCASSRACVGSRRWRQVDGFLGKTVISDRLRGLACEFTKGELVPRDVVPRAALEADAPIDADR